MGVSDINAKADTRLKHRNTTDWPTTASVVQMKRGRLVGARRNTVCSPADVKYADGGRRK